MKKLKLINDVLKSNLFLCSVFGAIVYLILYLILLGWKLFINIILNSSFNLYWMLGFILISGVIGFLLRLKNINILEKIKKQFFIY